MKRNRIAVRITVLLVISVCVLLVFFLDNRNNNTLKRILGASEKKDIIEGAIVISEEAAETMWNEDRDVGPYYDLSSEGELQSDRAIQEEEIFMIENKFKTNSTKITIGNQENIPITVCLYNTLWPESAIQEMDIKPLEKGIFDNLSAKYLYLIGVVSAENAEIKITIND